MMDFRNERTEWYQGFLTGITLACLDTSILIAVWLARGQPDFYFRGWNFSTISLSTTVMAVFWAFTLGFVSYLLAWIKVGTKRIDFRRLAWFLIIASILLFLLHWYEFETRKIMLGGPTKMLVVLFIANEVGATCLIHRKRFTR